MGSCMDSRKICRARITAAIIVLCLATLLSGCSGSSSYNPALSDLGGVYASRFSDMDLAIEISGRLSEDEAEETDIFMHENWGTEDIASDPAVFRGDPDSPVFDDGEGNGSRGSTQQQITGEFPGDRTIYRPMQILVPPSFSGNMELYG